MKMNQKPLKQDQIKTIFEQSGIDESIIKSWYKDWNVINPNGKMVNCEKFRLKNPKSYLNLFFY